MAPILKQKTVHVTNGSTLSPQAFLDSERTHPSFISNICLPDEWLQKSECVKGEESSHSWDHGHIHTPTLTTNESHYPTILSAMTSLNKVMLIDSLSKIDLANRLRGNKSKKYQTPRNVIFRKNKHGLVLSGPN